MSKSAAAAHTAVDAQRVSLVLNDLRLPAIKLVWADFAARADKEGWPGARLIAALAEHEVAERDRRRIERHLSEARLPPGKTLDSFAFDAVPMISRAQVTAMCSGRDGIPNAISMARSAATIPMLQAPPPMPGYSKRLGVKRPGSATWGIC